MFEMPVKLQIHIPWKEITLPVIDFHRSRLAVDTDDRRDDDNDDDQNENRENDSDRNNGRKQSSNGGNGDDGNDKHDDNNGRIVVSRIHNQSNSGLCWDYAAASSLRQSLRIKIASLENGQEKEEVLKFLGQGDHHQVLRKEILFGLIPTPLTVGKPQGVEMISDLMIFPSTGGFFRDSFPSIQHIGDLLNEPNIFKNVNYKSFKTVTYVRNNANRQENEKHNPIVGVKAFNGDKHAVMLEDKKIYTNDEGYEFIKLKKTWTEFPIIEVYLMKGAWKKNGDNMFCLLEPNSQQTDDAYSGSIPEEDEESNNYCYYFDFTADNDQI